MTVIIEIQTELDIEEILTAFKDTGIISGFSENGKGYSIEVPGNSIERTIKTLKNSYKLFNDKDIFVKATGTKGATHFFTADLIDYDLKTTN